MPPLHASITEPDSAKFRAQSAQGIQDILRHFESCTAKKSIQEAETALGWNAEMLRVSVLTDPFLSNWVTLQSFYFDSMHQYWSCGQVAQELGLWYTRLTDCKIPLEALQQWVALGWQDLGHTPPQHLFSNKMFKRDMDYRGDAQACLVVFPLCWAYSMEMLRDRADMAEAAIASLDALYAVTLVIHEMKKQPRAVEALDHLQRTHMEKFRESYGGEYVRPKVHFSRHLRGQVVKWQRHIDCFVTERKNTLFKSKIAPRLNRLSSFSASALLELTQCELNNTHAVERLTGRLVGKGRPQQQLAKDVHVTDEALFATGIEVGCVEFLRGHFLILQPNLCVEILHGMQLGESHHLVVERWLPYDGRHSPTCQQWHRDVQHGKYVLPAHKLKGHEPIRAIAPHSKSA